MMGQQNTEIDIESLQKSGRRRGGCLDVFVVLSIIFLFVAVAAVAVGGLMVVMELRSKLETARPYINVEALKQTGDTTEPSYKIQNFVYLEPNSSMLQTSTMRWEPIEYGEGLSLGSNFILNKEQSSLQPKQLGSYFIYIDLNLTCTYECPAGLLTVSVGDSVGDKLTCKVQLPAVANSIPVTKKCWTVTQLNDNQRLVTQMTVPNNGLKYWKLELRGSGFGMFLVD